MDPGVSDIDTSLLRAWHHGDAKAGRELIDRHLERMLRFFRHKAPGDPSDLAQETFSALLEAAGRFEGRASVRTYLYGIARNVLKVAIRKHSRMQGDPDFSTTSLEDLAPSPSSAVARSQDKQRLRVAMRRLAVDDQLALELTYWEDMTAREVAVILGLTEGGVRSRLRRARIRLREILRSLSASEAEIESSVAELEGPTTSPEPGR